MFCVYIFSLFYLFYLFHCILVVFNLNVHYWWLLIRAHSSLSSITLYYDVMSEDFGIRKQNKILSLENPLMHV